MSGNYRIRLLFWKTLLVFAEILSVALQVGLIIWLYFSGPTNRITVIALYAIISPTIAWIFRKFFPSMNFNKIFIISLITSIIVLLPIAILMSNLKILYFSSELINYISTLLFAILIYYIFGNNYSKELYDEKTIAGSFSHSYFIMFNDYNFYFMKTLIFIFYTFTLIFGQLRDLGIHNSSLFRYEQYAIVLIIAIDRIINSFAKEFPKAKEDMKIKKEDEKKKEKELFNKIFTSKLNEIKEQFELLLEINPEYDIEKLELWENANNAEHPQTKLLYLYVLLNVLSKDSKDKVDQLFISIGKTVKNDNQGANRKADDNSGSKSLK